MELNRPGGVDFRSCANIIRSDVTLTYRLMCMVQRLAYYRGNLVTGIQQALVLVGVDELRRWTLLSMARDNNVSRSDELIRGAFLRGVFAKRLMAATPHQEEDAEQGFLLGMFSMLDRIMDMDMPDLLADLELPPRMTEALLGEGDGEDFYCHLLQYVERYEARRGEPLPEDVAPGMSEREVSRLYMDSMVETDQTFNGMEEEAS
jgi:EAL and modified HD-GYP domain-containing signal transduction protein